jgi:hypothetical protein
MWVNLVKENADALLEKDPYPIFVWVHRLFFYYQPKIRYFNILMENSDIFFDRTRLKSYQRDIMENTL